MAFPQHDLLFLQSFPISFITAEVSAAGRRSYMDNLTGCFGIGTMHTVFQVDGTVFVEKHVFVVSVVPESEARSVCRKARLGVCAGKRGLE